MGKVLGHRGVQAMKHWDLPMLARGPDPVAVREVPPRVGRGPEGRPPERGHPARRALRLLRLPQDQGIRDLRKVGPDLSKIASKTSEEFIFRWIKEPRGLRPTRMPQFWDVRIDETDGAPGPQRRRGQRGGGLPGGEVGEEELPDAAPGRPRGGARALRDGGLPRLPPRRRGPPRPRRARQRVLPHLRAEPRRHGEQGQRRLALRLAARPQGLLARDEHAEPAAHPEGGGRHHRLPDEPEERGLPGPRAARRWTPPCGTRSPSTTSASASR